MLCHVVLCQLKQLAIFHQCKCYFNKHMYMYNATCFFTPLCKVSNLSTSQAGCTWPWKWRIRICWSGELWANWLWPASKHFWLALAYCVHPLSSPNHPPPHVFYTPPPPPLSTPSPLSRPPPLPPPPPPAATPPPLPLHVPPLVCRSCTDNKGEDCWNRGPASTSVLTGSAADGFWGVWQNVQCPAGLGHHKGCSLPAGRTEEPHCCAEPGRGHVSTAHSLGVLPFSSIDIIVFFFCYTHDIMQFCSYYTCTFASLCVPVLLLLLLPLESFTWPSSTTTKMWCSSCLMSFPSFLPLRLLWWTALTTSNRFGIPRNSTGPVHVQVHAW